MPKKKKIDNAKLVKAVKDGVEQAQIMKDFGYKTSTQLKVAYTNALIASGEIAAIKSGRGKAGCQGSFKRGGRGQTRQPGGSQSPGRGTRFPGRRWVSGQKKPKPAFR